MTSYFSLFVLMLSITLGMNVLAGAFTTSPAFQDLGTVEERKVLFGQIGTPIPDNLQGAFQEGKVDCAEVFDEQGNIDPTKNPANVDTLLEELCNPTKQNIETISTQANNVTTTTTEIDTTESAEFGQLASDIQDTSIISIGTFDNVIGALTGEFILRAVAGAFFGFCNVESPSCDPDSQLPQEFVDGFAVIVLLMFVGMVLSLIFGRSLATAG